MKMLKKYGAGGIVVNEFKEVALVLNPTMSWQFPKGTVEKGEDYLKTAKREIKEEIGLTVNEPIKKFKPYIRPSLYKNKRVMKEIHYFLFKIKKREIKPGAEIKECEWVSIDKVEEKITYEEDKKFFRDIKKIIFSLLP